MTEETVTMEINVSRDRDPYLQELVRLLAELKALGQSPSIIVYCVDGKTPVVKASAVLELAAKAGELAGMVVVGQEVLDGQINTLEQTLLGDFDKTKLLEEARGYIAALRKERVELREQIHAYDRQAKRLRATLERTEQDRDRNIGFRRCHAELGELRIKLAEAEELNANCRRRNDNQRDQIISLLRTLSDLQAIVVDGIGNRPVEMYDPALYLGDGE